MNPGEDDVHEGEMHKSRRALAIALKVILVMVGIVCVAVSVGWNKHENGKKACTQTGCISSSSFPPPALWNIVRLQLKVSMEKTQKACDFAAGFEHNISNIRERAAWRDCVELFEDTVYRLNASINKDVVEESVLVWLSAALTNMDTCLNGFTDLNITSTSYVKTLMLAKVVNVSELLTESLSMYKQLFSVWHNRGLLQVKDQQDQESSSEQEDGFPEWVSGRERILLQTSTPATQANVVVAKDGSGKYCTITKAVKDAPQKSSSRYVIYIKAGVYRENVEIPIAMTNLMFLGDGKNRTVVTGNRNVHDGFTTFNTSTLAVLGDGFIAKDMTFENTAGPHKAQAVALRVSADRSVVYRCSIKGYQDTLYAHCHRQFYREVDIYGTVDFIFGDAAVVIQNSNILVRRPLSHQKNTITAQGRTNQSDNTGISIHNCTISAASDLQPVKDSIQTYLGRPWKKYSRTVFMQSKLDDLIDPAGWLEWDGNLSLSTLYYGEYMNRGGGAGTSRRVKWGGYHNIKNASEANSFTVGQFISGNSWIPSTSIPFMSGLS